MAGKEACHAFCIDLLMAGQGYRLFRESVDDHEDVVVAMLILWCRLKVHSNVLPGVLWNRQRIQETGCFVSPDVGSLAVVTIADIAVNIILHPWPVISWT